MKRLIDNLEPKSDTLQIILKRRGKPVAGIYIDDKREVRSPTLPVEKEANEALDRKI